MISVVEAISFEDVARYLLFGLLFIAFLFRGRKLLESPITSGLLLEGLLVSTYGIFFPHGGTAQFLSEVVHLIHLPLILLLKACHVDESLNLLLVPILMTVVWMLLFSLLAFAYRSREKQRNQEGTMP